MTPLLLPVFFLASIGIFNIFGIDQSLAINQFIYVIIGISAFFIIKKIGMSFFSLNSTFFYWLFIGLLILTFLFGLEIRGSKRWINLYFFNLQSSEIFKAFYILHLSNLMIKDFRVVDVFKTFVLSLLFFLLPALLVFKQPDLGNAAVYFMIFMAVILFSDLPKKYLIYFCLILLLILPIGWNFMKNYQKERITSFLNPHFDQQGTAYNMTQAIITIGSGKFIGRGLGLGTQSRFFFLPENHTDFAYSSLVEQHGFVAGLIVIILYLVMTLIIIKRILFFYPQRNVSDRKDFLYLVGFITYFTVHILINLSMNLGLFPITGIALPFISFGGSSFVALMIGMALIP